MDAKIGECVKCLVCEARKKRKADLPSCVKPVVVNCLKADKFCTLCIQLYSRIDEKCPLCASDYTVIKSLEGEEEKLEKRVSDARKEVNSEEMSDDEKDDYINYLETISDISSEEEAENSDLTNAQRAELRIRNKVKQLRKSLKCEGVHCVSAECLSGHHGDDGSYEPIEGFESENVEWKEAKTFVEQQEKKLKREKTFEELLDECEKYVEEAIENEKH